MLHLQVFCREGGVCKSNQMLCLKLEQSKNIEWIQRVSDGQNDRNEKGLQAITAASHMFTPMLARMKIKVRMICGLKEINILIWEMAAKLITNSVP